MTNKDTTPTSGAADMPEALRRSTAADGKTELFNLPGYPLMVRAVDFNRIHTESEMRRAALLDEMQKAALAAGQATAAQQSGAKLNYSVLYVYANQHGIDYNSLCVAVREASAQPAAQQGVAYAALPDERAAFEAQFPVPGGVHWDGTEYVVKDSHVTSYRCNRFEGQWEAWKARASHGQAPATQQAGATKEHVHLVRVIADKIEDGTLFRSGIYSNKDLARFVRNVADAAAPQFPTTQAADSVTAPAPPPECETEAEKRAFAFGWFKALESERMKADNKKKGPL